MKVGILGLRPRQIAELQKQKLNGNVSFYNEKTPGVISVLAFVRDMDMLFVQSHGLPKRVYDAIPHGENRYFNTSGSVSSLLREMERVYAKHEMELYTQPVEPVPTKSDKKGTAPAPAAKPRKYEPGYVPAPRVVPATIGDLLINALQARGGQLSEIIPEGKTSEYTRPEQELVIHTVDPSGTTESYVETLKKAQIGQPVRFERPPIDFSEWTDEIRALIYHLLMRHDVDLEAHFYTNYVDLQLMREQQLSSVTMYKVKAAPEAVIPSDSIPPLRASDIPRGHVPRYRYPGNDLTIHQPNANGAHGYGVIEQASSGMVVRLAHPAGVSLAVWRVRLAAMRSYLKKRSGIVVETYYYDGFADLMVHSWKSLRALPVAAPLTSPAPVETTPVPVVVERVPVEKTSVQSAPIEETVDDHPQGDTSLDMDRTLPSDPFADADEEDRKFWSSVYVAVVAGSKDADEAALQADRALAQFRTRFG
ncbi:hypothetical protein LUCX_184 [Xanthomonas phage vB_XciM_LucasX]|nr:hypothetical protein LUCX_184 [Xanthomonas phage vB_XciM_LucasX]